MQTDKEFQSAADIAAGLGRAMKAYQDEQKAAPHDPMKVLAAGLVNEKMLYDSAKESEEAAAKIGRKAPTPKMLKQMQNWAFRYKKAHPHCTQEQLQQKVCNKFKLTVLNDESTSGSEPHSA